MKETDEERTESDENEDHSEKENVNKTTIKTTGKYIPPALRKLQNQDVDEEKLRVQRLKRQLKGLLNRYVCFVLCF